MRTEFITWFFSIATLTIFFSITIPVHSQCLDDQKSLLLQLKSSLEFDPDFSVKLVNWAGTDDCCQWNGVTCNRFGRVIGLDLNTDSISGGLNDSSSLFGLKFLEKLDLAYNSFNFAEIPSSFGGLTNLRYLNLSNTQFVGQIPMEFSHLTRLVKLDLSNHDVLNSYGIRIDNPNLFALFRNLGGLTELYLDGINISANGHEWGQAISSSLANLRVLSLSDCLLSGPIDSSLQKLQYLSVIDLAQNNLSSPVPDFFANFQNLSVLILSDSELHGTFPDVIFQRVQTLKTLDLSGNSLLNGSLPDFPEIVSLQNLVLSDTSFSGNLPESIENLRELRRIEIHGCRFSGPIPSSLAKLSQLVYLDFSTNNFSGSIPSFQGSKNLTFIDLSHNALTGPVSSIYFEGLSNLANINLGFNSFNGSIPSSLFFLPSLQEIDLSYNQFGEISRSLPNGSLSPLITLDLSTNKIQGSFPSYLFDFQSLNNLFISSNNLSGTLQLESFHRLQNLKVLELSYNSLSVNASISESSLPSFPQLIDLALASCKLQKIPPIMNQSSLLGLDLSDNQISGLIPNWIWNISNGYLNLSSNLLVGFQQGFVIPVVGYLDLHSNQLSGAIPLPIEGAYVDYSRNNFNSSIPAEIGNRLPNAWFFSLSYNNLSGPIPPSICNGSLFEILNLSNNRFSGTIPQCLIDKGTTTLNVLNLHNNNLTGNIMGTFPKGCTLRTLELNGNNLEGEVPNSLTNCANLEVLNLGTNNINGKFPCFLANLSKLRVLVLRFNKFHGNIGCQGIHNYIWPKLQIIDLALNNFNGILPPKFFSQRKAMMDGGNAQPNLNPLRFKLVDLLMHNYQDPVVIAFKEGLNMKQVEILTIFYIIDLSNNNFTGNIPDTIGNLKSLNALNLSHNALTGSIPSSLGNLTHLGSLDLSWNKLGSLDLPLPLETATYVDYSSKNFSSSIPAEIGNSITSAIFFSISNNLLTGAIPHSLCKASFLEVLDLSNNRFSGSIPQCLIETCTATLRVLDLHDNNLIGNITGTFPEGCALRNLDLNGNHLEGQVPKSLANCANMEVLNIGTNKINGNFPCFLTNLSSLHILVLQSNKFHGNIHCQGIHQDIWPKLQIIDLALNSFSGIVPPQFFLQRKEMMDGGNVRPYLNHLRYEYYQYSVTIICKGLEMKLVKILTIFTAIDFSNNSFEGEIPDTVGYLKSLYVLNLSHNALIGSIPSSLGNLTQLESLDLSWNKLGGSIPGTLASLTFLAFLNLSYNQLVGMIPRGSQLQTFSETSFKENKGLCGTPLITSCKEGEQTMPTFDGSHKDEINWVYIAATLGYTLGFGVIVGPLLYSKRWRQFYYKPLDRVIVRTLHRREQQARHQRRRDNRNQLRRRQHH